MKELVKKLDLYVEDRKASQAEIDLFLDFVQNLKASRKIRFIYRGNSKILDDYNICSNDMTLLSHYIFCLGDKGTHFLNNKIINIENIYTLIWDKFHAKVCQNDFKSNETRKHVDKFLKENPEFMIYFSNNKHRHKFENLALSRDKKEAYKIADYYTSILHSIGKSANSDSYFLSASTKYKIADKFKGKDNIIIYGWIPKKGLKDRIVKYEEMNKCNVFIKALGLPIQAHPLYPEQNEICLKCGLLPHFIVGFQQNDRFFINPNALKPWHNDIVYKGLDIDQADFNNLFNATKCKQSFVFCDGNYYLIQGRRIKYFTY